MSSLKFLLFLSFILSFKAYSQNFMASASTGIITTTDEFGMDSQVFVGFNFKDKILLGLESMYANIESNEGLSQELAKLEVHAEWNIIYDDRIWLSLVYGMGVINIFSETTDDFTFSTTSGFRFYAIENKNIDVGFLFEINFNSIAPYSSGNFFFSYTF